MSYATLITGSLLYNHLAFTLVILVFTGLAMVEFQRLIDLKSYMPIALIILLVYNFFQSKINTLELLYPLVSVFIAHSFLIYWLYSNKSIQLRYLSKILLTLFYMGLGCFFIIAIAGNTDKYEPKNILLFFALIWTNNSLCLFGWKESGEKTSFLSYIPQQNMGRFFFRTWFLTNCCLCF